jgi:nucleotide-binding universal stress UspA family protein
MPQLDVMRRIFVEQAAAHAKEILDPVKEAATKVGIECDTVVATGNSPYATIIKQAKESRCDLIMMATHARKGIQRILHGSETAKVLTHSKIPVLVVR